MIDRRQELHLITPDGSIVNLPASQFEPLATRYMGNYPALYHFTSEDSAEKIITSKSLLARNILEFNEEDVEEYRYGIRMVRDYLHPAMLDSCKFQPNYPNFKALEQHGFNATELSGAVTDLLVEELHRIAGGLPRVSIYVACFSAARDSVHMAGKFGRYQIAFGPLLPVLAYAKPARVMGTMLSRVTYDEYEFRWFIGEQCSAGSIYLLLYHNLPKVPAKDRLRFAAEMWAQELMMAAANIKRPAYSQEAEWRFKICLQRDFQWINDEQAHVNRAKFGLASEAEFTDEQPPRFVQRLSLDGKAIINMVKTVDESGAIARPSKFDALRREHTTGQMNISAAQDIIARRGLS